MLDTMDGVWMQDVIRPKDWDGRPVAFFQAKHDGHRVTHFQQPDRELGLCSFGRDRRPHLEMSHRLDVGAWPWYYALRDKLPPQSSVDGELWYPGKPASFVKTALKEQLPGLTFTPFAVPCWKGAPVPALAAAQYICKHELGLTFSHTWDWRGQTPEDMTKRARSHGVEGYVMKEAHLGPWWKVKVTQTIDLLVTGLKDAEPGKFFGMVGSLLCSAADGTEVACVSGMDDETRVAITSADVGRIVEVEYQSVLSKGRLQHPRFVRWRDDKAGADQLEVEEVEVDDG